jgi:hypothetical protein
MKKLTLILITLIAFCLAANAQTVKTYETKEEAQKNAGQGITYKVPDKYMAGPFAGFKGMTMLNPEKPVGIFISYPNENESIEALKARLLPAIAKMFLHDEKVVEKAVWQTKILPVHAGDKGDKAVMNLHEGEQMTLQVTFYEREHNGLTFVYGYFAMKLTGSKKSKDFLDDSGQGVKEFEKFWKSFPTK